MILLLANMATAIANTILATTIAILHGQQREGRLFVAVVIHLIILSIITPVRHRSGAEQIAVWTFSIGAAGVALGRLATERSGALAVGQ